MSAGPAAPRIIAFTKVDLPYGWLGSMSPHPIEYGGKYWKTAEALFQALRFQDAAVIEAIRQEASPMKAKMISKKHKAKWVVQPCTEEDLNHMRLILELKVKTHELLYKRLLASGDAVLIEDCCNRGASKWGAQLVDGQWVGENLLGKLWMELRAKLQACPPLSP